MRSKGQFRETVCRAHMPIVVLTMVDFHRGTGSVGALAASIISPGGGGGTDSRPGTGSRMRGVFAAVSDPNLLVLDAHGSPGHSGGGRWYQQDTGVSGCVGV